MLKNYRDNYTFIFMAVVFVFLCFGATVGNAYADQWVVVDTGQDKCYDDNGNQITCPGEGAALYGQDSQYNGTQPSYRDNGDGTITDLNTGLMWQKNADEKMYWSDAVSNASTFNLAGYTDWRLPTIKELYSLMNFNGVTGMSAATSTPYIDTDYFEFKYGDESAGERFIDSQWATSTIYVSTTMGGNITMFGVNFADGRIKGYPRDGKLFYVKYVRGDSGYGENNFLDNGDGTITDLSTGLMWLKNDSGHFGAGDNGDGKLNWQQALAWAESLEHAGHSDWRLPNAKELQGIVDYTRSPATTDSPAIDPVFNTSSILDDYGQVNYPYFWTGTTHLEGNMKVGVKAVYIAFGEAQGYMQDPRTGSYTLMDVHGAGAQRSDLKKGDPADYPYGQGPQGDIVSIYNFVRCVRDVTDTGGGSEEPFGSVDTPVDGAAVRGSIAVTGWALDDTGVEQVIIYRQEGSTLYPVGEAVFVEGARPDIESKYPDYPNNSRAGWGYMLLTYGLPGQGNGEYTLVVQATDGDGNTVTLGTKTIYCDNKNAVKPFGAVDTPAQGGIASGSNYINYGWVLTPSPSTIPTDGSTIGVYVDGVKVGEPQYNINRSDIAGMFPGYANSGGSGVYFELDTTQFENGVHTIEWRVKDDAGNGNGIGSRYFTISN